MDIFETDIVKYERRLERIERNPNANMLASNKIFYQALLEDNREQLKWWREGKPFVAVGPSDLALIMRCFGDFRILNLARLADRLGTRQAEAAADRIRAMGLPDYVCDRTILFLPLSMLGNDLPKPKIMLTRTGSCNVVNDTIRTLGHMTGIPVFTVDVPFSDPHQEHLDHVTRQLENLIVWVEENLPGAKFDENKLAEWQRYAKRWHEALHIIYEARKHIPCPDHPRDVFREPMHSAQFASPALIVEYYEAYAAELQERVKRGFVPVGEEKLRIVWSITGPYGSNVWDYLARRGVSVPCWLYGNSQRNFVMLPYGETSEFGRALSPLEEEARRMVYNSWGGTAERWINDTISVCKEFKADGLVQFEQTGCMPVLGLGELVGKRLEEEMGIPSWRVEGRQLLGHTERAETEFMAGLEAFINLCFERKKQA